MLAWTAAILYTLGLLYLFVFSLGQLHLALIYRRGRRMRETETPRPFPAGNEPLVTVQLPVYNEKYVIERLIDAVISLDYPAEKLEIQILDDSTDETTGIIWQKLGWTNTATLDIRHIRRDSRKGFKAGALADALPRAKGEFIAIFDADFIPEPDFLQQTLPWFTDQRVGAVQTRWAHVNENYSLLTRLQAFGLNAHFAVEQSARNAAGSFINFNGTCGIWRKACIEDAGGWQDDTLTEDLDLSYRAQLKGWRFRYLEDLATPGELPVLMPVIKLQQYRWNKGAAETARKMLGKVLRSDLSLRQKLHAFLHLNNSAVFVALLLAAISSVPLMFLAPGVPHLQILLKTGAVFLVGFFGVAIFYWTAAGRFGRSARHKFFLLFPAFLVISMGLCLHNGIAVIEGWLGVKSPFIRTPKFNILSRRDSWLDNTYVKPSVSVLTLLEGALCGLFLYATVKGLESDDHTFLVFHAMLALGFGIVFLTSIKPWANA